MEKIYLSDNIINLILSGKKTNLRDKKYKSNEEYLIKFYNEKDACIIKTKTNGEFKLIKNLVKERLELGKKIALYNKEIFKDITDIYEINSGFNNTLFNINNKYVVKVCTNKNKEKSFDKEYEFYINNKENKNIPKLYKYDKSKKDIPYIYEIIEKVPGKTLYYYYYKMNEKEKEETIKKIINIVKEFHKKIYPCSSWKEIIKSKISENIKKSKDILTNKEYKIITNSYKYYDIYLDEKVRCSLLHNDLHFDNILYDKGNIKIIDFNDTLIGPIDYEFRLFYQMQDEPYRWADLNMDPYQKKEDFKTIFSYTKKYYQELNNIKYLEERQIIYKILDASKFLQKDKNVKNKLIKYIKLLEEKC